jgi:hypothetical protein
MDLEIRGIPRHQATCHKGSPLLGCWANQPSAFKLKSPPPSEKKRRLSFYRQILLPTVIGKLCAAKPSLFVGVKTL